MIPAGQLKHHIMIERATVATDDYGGETKTWSKATEARTRIKWGTGQERRTAAQESAVQTATFECNWTPKLDAVDPTCRVQFDDSGWDITSAVPVGHHDEVHITATRSV